MGVFSGTLGDLVELSADIKLVLAMEAGLPGTI